MDNTQTLMDYQKQLEQEQAAQQGYEYGAPQLNYTPANGTAGVDPGLGTLGTLLTYEALKPGATAAAAPAAAATPVAGSAAGEAAGLGAFDMAAMPGAAAAPVGWTGGAFGSGLGLAGIPAGAGVGYLQGQGVANAIKGDKLDTAQELALALPTGGASLVWDKFGFGGTQDKDTRARMELKGSEGLRSLFGDELMMQTASGPRSLLEAEYNIDFNDPQAAQTVGWLQPLAYFVANGDKKLASDFTGELYNTIKGATPEETRKNVLAVYQKYQGLGLTPSFLREWLQEEVKQGRLDQGSADAYFAATDSLKAGGGMQDLTKPVGGVSTAGANPGAVAPAGSPGAGFSNIMQMNGQQGPKPPPVPTSNVPPRVAAAVTKPKNLNQAYAMMGPIQAQQPAQKQPVRLNAGDFRKGSFKGK